MLKLIDASSQKHVETVRRLLTEYADSLAVDLSFQDFKKEVAELPGEYVPPAGRLYLALDGTRPAGCIALRKISDDVCEMKRLYVRPLFRGKGLGRKLAAQVIGEARRIGYKRMLLDTLPLMKRATALYRSLGFRPIPRYRENPVPGALFMELDLS